MQLPWCVRSTTFRWTFLVASAFAVFTVALLGFVYLKMKHDLTMRSDRAIGLQMDVLADLPPGQRLDSINEGIRQDPARVRLVGLFGPDRGRIAGNVESEPSGLKMESTAQNAVVVRIDGSGREKQAARLIARSLPDGNVLVIGRNADEVEEIARVVGWVLALGLIPGVLLCLAVGLTLSARARRRIVEVNERVQRIVAGNLRERLPHRNTDDPFSKLAMIVNGMIDEMETLIQSLAGVGNDIAHDLRTPLTRARLMLERGRANASTVSQLQAVADKTIEALDQSLSIVNAILRLTEIERSQRLAGFGEVALANLVDNAIKFTPAGGQVEIGLFHGCRENVVCVRDTGSGISERERHAVLGRFYRSNKVRHTSGLGLGLNLVAAIVKLHGFRFTIHPGPGCMVEIACPHAPTPSSEDHRAAVTCS